MSPTALVVEPVLADVLLLVPILSELGFEVTTAEDFHEAKRNLRVPPSLLITEVRLREYNGLQLVLRHKSLRADAAAIVTSRVDDPVLEKEAEHMGATFVMKPIDVVEWRAAISRTVIQQQSVSFVSVRAPFERRKAQRRTAASQTIGPERRGHDRRRDIRDVLGTGNESRR